MAFVGQQQAAQLLHNKFVVVIGDSIQRSVYKDLVMLLQRGTCLSPQQLRSKGELTFQSDVLVEGGCHDDLHNGTDYREVRQFRAPPPHHQHLLRFYFVTRVFSAYMRSILEDLRRGPAPDLLVVNSCIWDISRYKDVWEDEYKENLHRFFRGLAEVLPEESLVVWNLTMPLGHKIRGGFLTPEVANKAGRLRFDVVEANFCGAALAEVYGHDVLDLHCAFRGSLGQRVHDGIHWNAAAHRRITSLLLAHAADAWGVRLPPPPLLPPADAAGANTGALDYRAPAPAPKSQAYPSDHHQHHLHQHHQHQRHPGHPRSPYVMRERRRAGRAYAPYSVQKRRQHHRYDPQADFTPTTRQETFFRM